MDRNGQDKVAKFIEDKWKHGGCPVCGSDSWQVAGELGDLPLSDTYANDLSAIGAVYPLLPIFCTVCGYTLLFNSNIAFADVPSEPHQEPNPPEQPR